VLLLRLLDDLIARGEEAWFCDTKGHEILNETDEKRRERYLDKQASEALLARLDEACAGTLIEEKGNTPISIASGFALYEAGSDLCFNDVFKRADKAMYENKRKCKEGRAL
jgi:GGDEF domain-containing protein